ncbi:MAG TPA: MFS transporter [Caldilineaceae bacterium]|nr:MFS transporter [Caldilineaceae bacterium]
MAKLYYFCFFAAIGCLVPFLNVYFAGLGLSGAEIGWLSSVAPLIALTANPFWGAVADRWQIHRWVLACCALAAGLVSLLFLAVNDFWPLLLVVVVLSFFRTPIASLLDSTVLDLVRRIGGHYGRQRMWGSVGFVTVTLGLARVVALDNLQAAFWLHGLLLGVVCTVLGLFLPIASRKGKVALWSGLRQLAGQRSYVTFLGAMALLGIGTSSYVNFLGLHILALGGDSGTIAAAWAANAIAEFPMLFLGGRWFARFGYSRLIVAGFAGYALVWSLMAVAPAPGLLLACAALIGLCYGTLWAAAVNYASDAAPPGLNATAQALVGAAQAGVGWGIGSVLAGYLWDGYGGQAVYWAATVAALAGGALFWLGNRHELTIGIRHTERANSLQ